MDKQIDSRFERLEKALMNLIDSVTKYHPSVAQADELKTADAELTKGLEQVQQHQNNHLRILQLRSEADALDTQIRETLSTLAVTRKDIIGTNATVFPSEPSFPIAYEALLRYARRISKTSMPPAGIVSAAALLTTTSPEAQTPMPLESQPLSAATPSAPASTAQSPAVVPSGGPSRLGSQQPPATQQTATSLNTTLPEIITQYLNPMSGQLFFPWPQEDKIRGGALASNQILVERGIDPTGFDPAAEEERKRREEEERKEKEEWEKRERAEYEKKMVEERERLRVERERQREKEQQEWRRDTTAAGPPGQPSRSNTGAADKKQFQFANLDDLDDDDDDDD